MLLTDGCRFVWTRSADNTATDCESTRDHGITCTANGRDRQQNINNTCRHQTDTYLSGTSASSALAVLTIMRTHAMTHCATCTQPLLRLHRVHVTLWNGITTHRSANIHSDSLAGRLTCWPIKLLSVLEVTFLLTTLRN